MAHRESSQHHSAALVPPGPVTASFPLHFRVSGAQPAEGRRYHGSVVEVRVTSEPVQQFDYKIKISLSSPEGRDVFHSFFRTPFVNSSPLDFSNKLERPDGYNRKARAHFGHLKRVPHIRYEKIDEVEGRFVASVPPYASMYTDAFGFWDTLGFAGGGVDDGYKILTGSKMQNGEPCDLYGFENREPQLVEYLSRRMASEGEPLDALYEDFAGAAAVNNLQLEVRVFQEALPIALAKPRALTRHQAVEGLSVIIDEGLTLLNVDETFVTVVALGRYLVVKSRELSHQDQAAARVKVVVELSEQLANFLQTEDPVLEFPLHEAKEYQLEPQDDASYDPLHEYYPVYLIPEGHGAGNDYIEGRGFTSVLTTMRGPGDFVGSGSVFYGDRDELRLTFLDRSYRQIVTREPLKVFLGLELRSLF